MSTGPCMCGDPYCGRCGNPMQLEIEDAMEELINFLGGYCQSLEDIEFLKKIIPTIMGSVHTVIKEAVENERIEQKQYQQYLQERIDLLTNPLG